MKSLNQLRSALAQWDYDFPQPQIELEQYNTPIDLAALCIWNAYLNGDIFQKVILDLGCGTGILSQACKLVGAALIIGIDIDHGAMQQANELYVPFSLTEFLRFPVTQKSLRSLLRVKCDVAITNPPFGTKNQEHADTLFVREALSAADIVYSFHLSTSYEFLKNWSMKEFDGVSMQLVARVDYPLVMSYKKHRQSSKIVKVDILRWNV